MSGSEGARPRTGLPPPLCSPPDRSSSPPTSPDGPAAGEAGAGERELPGAAAGAAAAGAGGGSQAALSVAAASDISRVSVDSHHSHRSRWSTAATVATTVAPNHGRHHDPALGSAAPLPEAESGDSSGEGTPVDATAGSARGRSAFGGGRSASGGHGGGLSRSVSSPRQDSRGSSGRGASAGADATGSSAVAPTAADSGADAAVATLPPRLVVFHPAGDFAMGVDKAREAELQAAAAAAAARRQQHRQRAAAAARGPAGVRPQPGSAAGQDTEGATSAYAGYRAIYIRQKVVLVSLLLVDIVYLAVLLILRLSWGDEKEAPDLNAFAKFFVGSSPHTTSISFLAGAMFTDLIALYGAVQDYPSIITLFIVWSVVLGAFAMLELAIFFIILRLLLLISGFQLRFSMSRMRHLLPPTSFGGWIAGAGRGFGAAASSAWSTALRPFQASGGRRRPSPQAAAPGAAAASGAAARGTAQPSGARADHPPVVGGPSASRQAPAGPDAAQLAGARSSALFRAALMRMVSEQERGRQEAEEVRGRDLEQGAAPGAEPSRGRPSATPGARAATESQPGGSSLERLYSRIMEDISAVAAAPSGGGARQRQRRQERESRRRAVTASGTAAPPRQPSAGASNADAGTGDDDLAAPSGPAGQGGAVERAAAAAQRSAAAAAPRSGPPSLQELVMLLSFHTQQVQLRRQQAAQQSGGVVPLVSLDAPAPLADGDPPRAFGGSSCASGAATPRV